jgi:hypothetical protein
MAVWRRTLVGWTLCCCWLASPDPATAQQQRPTTPWQLPRPGYEPHLIKAGPLVVAPALDVSEGYDSNVFAAHNDVEGDFVTHIVPSVTAKTDHGGLSLTSRLWADQAVFAEHSEQDNTTFGGEAEGRYALNRRSELSMDFSGAHLAESRADPESTRGRDQSPAAYNTASGTLGYAYTHNRVTLSANARVARYNYLDRGEQDRDRTEYRGALRGSYTLTPRFSPFLEAYVERRDVDTARDRDGLDRDSFTTGFYVGTNIDITDKWWGEVAVGLFHVDNDDPALRPFLGVGARGAVTWSITPRSALTASVRREDVATIEIGASGRIETEFGLALEQEARHNLLTKVEVGVLQETYKEEDRQMVTPTGSASLEYLVNRRMSLTGTIGYANRFSDRTLDRYERYYAMLGVHVQF